MTNAQAAAQAFPVTTGLALLGEKAEASVQDALKLFQESIQKWLDTPLDAGRVAEWTTLRSRPTA